MMSAANWFIALGLFAVAAAGGGIAYRHGADLPEMLSCPAPIVNVPKQETPIVNVSSAPAQVQVSAPAPAPAREVAIVKRKPKPKPKPVSNVKKLRTEWGAS
jgi:hypothetical protein